MISFQHGDVQPLPATVSVGFVRRGPPRPDLARGGSLGNVTATSRLAFRSWESSGGSGTRMASTYGMSRRQCRGWGDFTAGPLPMGSQRGCSTGDATKELSWPPASHARGFWGLYSPATAPCLLWPAVGHVLPWSGPRSILPSGAPLHSLQFIVISSLLDQPPLTLFDYQYPEWSISVGYLIGASSFICIPFYMVYKLVWTPGSLKQVRSGTGSPGAPARAGGGQGPPPGESRRPGSWADG